MTELFEKWVIAQFNGSKNIHLLYKTNGIYDDEIINAMWIGFNAHAELTK